MCAYLQKSLLVFLLAPAAVVHGAMPPLNGGYSVVRSALFHAGGAMWTYTRYGSVERLECAGPLSTSVHVQVKGTPYTT